MFKIILAIIAGIALSVLSALLGLSNNENNHKAKSAAITGEMAGVAERSSLHLVHPTEPGAVATVRIKLSEFTPVDLYVTDRRGERVRSLIKKYLSAGVYQISWYGETDLTRPLAPGVYVLTLDASDSRQMVKVILDR